MKQVLAILIFVGLAAGLGWLVYQRLTEQEQGGGRPGPGGPGGPRGNAAVAVEIAPIRTMTIRDVGVFTGTLLPEAQFIVAPKVAGRLEELKVNFGDPVERDQLIAVLEDDEYAQQVEQARAELDVAGANVEESSSTLEVARREYERAQALRLKKIASESELDLAETDYRVKEAKYRVALAQVEQRRAALKAAQIRLSYTQIRAAWEGGDDERIVGERFCDDGAMLAVNTPIVSILDIDPLRAAIHIIERDYSRVQPGQEAMLTTDAYPATTFTGTVVRVAPLLKETSRQARVEIEVPNADRRLKPGMFIRARIEFRQQTDATVVPIAALARREGRQGVFLADLENRTARFVPVTLGIVNGDRAEVVSPKLSGSVVTLGQHLLTDGGAITVPDLEPTGEPSGERSRDVPTTGSRAGRGGRP